MVSGEVNASRTHPPTAETMVSRSSDVLPMTHSPDHTHLIFIYPTLHYCGHTSGLNDTSSGSGDSSPGLPSDSG